MLNIDTEILMGLILVGLILLLAIARLLLLRGHKKTPEKPKSIHVIIRRPGCDEREEFHTPESASHVYADAFRARNVKQIFRIAKQDKHNSTIQLVDPNGTIITEWWFVSGLTDAMSDLRKRVWKLTGQKQ